MTVLISDEKSATQYALNNIGTIVELNPQWMCAVIKKDGDLQKLLSEFRTKTAHVDISPDKEWVKGLTDIPKTNLQLITVKPIDQGIKRTLENF